eukprot:6479152-Amphidinium_carterae.2
MSRTRPAYVEINGWWPDSGKPLKFLLKGTLFDDGGVFWNTDILLQQLSGNSAIRVGRWYSREGKPFLDSLGEHARDHYCRSHLAARKTPIESERTTQEYTLSTLGVLRLCLWWSAARATVDSKKRGEPLLRCILAALMDGADYVRWPVPLLAHVVSRCDHQAQGGVCLHVQTLLHDMDATQTEPLERQTQLLMRYLQYECLSCQEGALAEVERLSACVNARAVQGAYKTDIALAVSSYVERGSKRRVDAHVRSAVISAPPLKRARTKLGMQVFVPRARQLAWEAEHLRGMLTAATARFESLDSASVAFDGSRMSKPSEETLAFLFQECKTRLTLGYPSRSGGQETQNS